MNGVSRRFMGPAGPVFLHDELDSLGVDFDSISLEQLRDIAARVQRSAVRVMPASQADDFAEALLACADQADAPDKEEIDSDLTERIVEIATDYLGPAAQTFLAQALKALDIDERVGFHQVRALAEHVRHSARRLMDQARADAFADRIIACGGGSAPTHSRGRSLVIDVTATTSGGSRAGRVPESTKALPVFDAALLDACRALRANLAGTEVDGCLPNLIVLGASAHPECGRVAAGLAMAIAEDGTTTLLVDADIVSPSLHEPFGLKLENGFAEAITSDLPILMPARVGPFLSVLTAGQLREADDSRKIGLRIGQLAKGLAERFGCVVYHCSVTAGRTLSLIGPHVGGAVLVVRLGIDTADTVRAARQQLERAGVEVLGVAPVDAHPRESVRFAWARTTPMDTTTDWPRKGDSVVR